MLLRIVHHTRYDYTPPVVTAQHLAHLQPLVLPDQEVLSHHVSIQPEPANVQHSVDAFGNPRFFFSLQSAHDRLDVQSDAVVNTQAPLDLPQSLPWDQVRDLLQYHSGATYDPANEFAFASPFVPRSTILADFARPVFEPGEPLLECAQALMARIHTEMTYEGGSTGINTPVLDALAQRKGVCQDFAHIMIGCLRSLGLPARYVSGYLLTHPPEGQPRMVGADASHAWVQVYSLLHEDKESDDNGDDTPPGCWVDFDPTNNRSGWGRPGEDYVTLAVGRDFGDVSPLRGVIQGGSSHRLSVAVTVAPPHELEGTELETAPDATPPAQLPETDDSDS
jgi:transglutaminase-like putative cysteine protease